MIDQFKAQDVWDAGFSAGKEESAANIRQLREALDSLRCELKCCLRHVPTEFEELREDATSAISKAQQALRDTQPKTEEEV